MLRLNQFKQLDSLESQIDRLNFRVSQFVNSSICSESESEEPFGGHNKRISSIDLASPLKIVQGTLDDDSQSVFSKFCQVSMKLEDLLSARAYCEDRELGKNYNRNVEEEKVQIVDLKDLYGLVKQVQHAICLVESGVSAYVSIDFLGTCKNCQVIGAEFPEKSEIFNCLSKISDSADLKTCNFFNLPQQFLTTFCSTFEDSMKNQYFDHLFSSEYKQSKVIKEKKVFDNKSWALLQASYKKLKNYNENCENISKTLDWQRTELQVLKSELNLKLQAVLKKEGELTFRQDELTKHQQEYQESIKSFEAKQQTLLADQVSLDSYKKKLDKMKLAIKCQLEDLNKSNFLSQKLTNSTLTDQNQGLLKRLKSNSTLNSDKADSEAEFSQTEIQNSEFSLITPTHASKDFSFDRPLSSNKKLTLPTKLGFLSPQNNKTESFLQVPSKDLHLDKLHFLRTNNKPPTSSSTISNSDLLSLREERLSEREAELEKREKEIQKTWLKNPNAQEFIPMIQSEMVRLKSLQREYDKKVKTMQDRINKSANFEETFNKKFSKQTCHSARDSDFKDFSSINSDEESFIIHSRVEKLKDLYSMMEELV